MRNTFKRGERLKSRKAIAKLMREGQSFSCYPLRLVWTVMEEKQSDFPVQFGQSVPKKKFPKATHRNRLRRLVREAYRLNKYRLYRKLELGGEKQIAFFIIYVAKEVHSFSRIQSAMKQIMKRLTKQCRTND